MPRFLVTVGTNTEWGPPQYVEFGLDDSMNIINVSAASWILIDSCHITRVAVKRDGQWYECGKGKDHGLVEAGNSVVVEIGGIRYNPHLNNPFTMDEERQLQASYRGLLESARRLLNK